MSVFDEFISSRFFDAGFRQFLTSKLSSPAVNKYDWVLRTLQVARKYKEGSGVAAVHIRAAIKAAAEEYFGVGLELSIADDGGDLEAWLREGTRTRLVDGLWSLDEQFAQIRGSVLAGAPCRRAHAEWAAISRVLRDTMAAAAADAGIADAAELARDLQGADRLWCYMAYAALTPVYDQNWTFSEFEEKASGCGDVPMHDSDAVAACRTAGADLVPGLSAAAAATEALSTLAIQYPSDPVEGTEEGTDADVSWAESEPSNQLARCADMLEIKQERPVVSASADNMDQANDKVDPKNGAAFLRAVQETACWAARCIPKGLITTSADHKQLVKHIEALESFHNLDTDVVMSGAVFSLKQTLREIQGPFLWRASRVCYDASDVEVRIAVLLLRWSCVSKEEYYLELLSSRLAFQTDFLKAWSACREQVKRVVALWFAFEVMFVYSKHGLNTARCRRVVQTCLQDLGPLSTLSSHVVDVCSLRDLLKKVELE